MIYYKIEIKKFDTKEQAEDYMYLLKEDGCNPEGLEIVEVSTIDESLNSKKGVVECCGTPMEHMGIYLHCMQCRKTRLIEFPHGKDRKVISEMVLSYIQEYDPTWAELQKIIHELWRAGHYDGYEPKLPEGW